MPARLQLVFVGISLGLFAVGRSSAATVPVVTSSNVTVRVMAANLSSGNFQRYEPPGLRILQGLRPDIVAIQEFNYAGTNGTGTDTPEAIREMVHATFGTNFTHFRETNAGYNIPNGIISRWPIRSAGSWDDPQLNNRGFAWALVDVPGTNDLYVVSVHLHNAGGASSRALEAAALKSAIQTNFPPGASFLIAGDFNADSRTEAALMNLATIVRDSPVPADAVAGGDSDTSQNRNNPYDYVLPSFNLASNQTATVLGALSFSRGLVFDSRVANTGGWLNAVSPAQAGDSGVSMMQHMGVVKDFLFRVSVTNFVTVPPPRLAWQPPNRVRWLGVSNLTYTVQASPDLGNWANVGAVFSSTTNFVFTNSSPGLARRYLRVTYQ